jgi:hypothetical protein
MASLNGYYNPISLGSMRKWEASASFIVNGNAAFMMRGARGYISVIVLEDKVTFQASDQFWSRNPTDPIIDERVTPKECLMEFRNLVEMMSRENRGEDAERALEHLELLVICAMEEGFLPVHPLDDIAPTIEYLVLQELLKYNIHAIDYDFDVDYGSVFMIGSLNRHQFNIAFKFDGNQAELDVHLISNFHKSSYLQANTVKAVFFDGIDTVSE